MVVCLIQVVDRLHLINEISDLNRSMDKLTCKKRLENV